MYCSICYNEILTYFCPTVKRFHQKSFIFLRDFSLCQLYFHIQASRSYYTAKPAIIARWGSWLGVAWSVRFWLGDGEPTDSLAVGRAGNSRTPRWAGAGWGR